MRRLNHAIHLICLLLLPVLAVLQGATPSHAQSSGQNGMIRGISVVGNQRIETGTIVSYMLIKEGDAYDNRRVDRSLKSLFATGLFADVTIRRDGEALIVTVVENPVINRIAFEGNKRLKDEDLDQEMSLRPRVIYTRTKVQNDVKRILTLYRRKGRFAATVEPKVIQQPQNRVDLIFEINEGKWTEVRNIRFIGNGQYSDARLREIIRTRESRWYRFLSSEDNFDPDRMTLDRELLRRFYLSAGYADFRVASAVAELAPDRKDFFITFTVEEGDRYSFGDVKLDINLRGLKEEDIADVIDIEKEDWYDIEEVENTVDNLTNAIGGLGISFVDIRPRIKRNREDKTVSVTFEINEGPRIFVERIDIEGNVRTSDEVIRREFRLVEGDAFNPAKLRRSRQRLQNLDFFQTVNVEQVPGDGPDKTAVKVEVEEKSTGSLSLGFGFSTTSGALADIGVSERNLLGRGQYISLKGTIASRKTEIDFSFTEPYFLGRDIAAGIDIFRTTKDLQDASSYDSKSTGFNLRAGYPITEHLRQSWVYTAKLVEVKNVASTASEYIKDEEGEQTLSKVSHNITYDTRDDIRLPTDGVIIKLSNGLAGFGGDRRYLSNELSGGKFFPLYDQWVLSVGGSLGYIVGIGQDVKLTDRFFIGGDDLRGFATSGVGPRDNSTLDSLGGEWMYKASAELMFPIGLPQEIGVSGKIFTDLGSVGGVSPDGTGINDTGSMRLSIGTGIVWISPFGPVGIDFGIPIIKETFDETETVRVNFGTRF